LPVARRISPGGTRAGPSPFSDEGSRIWRSVSCEANIAFVVFERQGRIDDADEFKQRVGQFERGLRAAFLPVGTICCLVLAIFLGKPQSNLRQDSRADHRYLVADLECPQLNRDERDETVEKADDI